MNGEHVQKRAGLLILVAVLSVATAFLFSRPPIPQPVSYHNFADQRVLFGVPNFMDVVSNLPFLCVGVWGLLVVASRNSSSAFLAHSERWAYAAFFLGVVLTSFGSSYYHLHPSNARLVWDRLPMSLAFMGFLAAIIADRISEKVGALLLLPLVIAGGLSVVYWHWSEVHGRGDLRPYLLVQFGSLLAIVIMVALFHARSIQTWYVVVAIALYGSAKLFETFDLAIFGIGRSVSGHTLKHLAAAAGTYLILLMLRRRYDVPREPLVGKVPLICSSSSTSMSRTK